MIITKKNIHFYRLKEEDIELVRHWRNHPSIQKHMVYRERITAEMQKEWFKTIDNNLNLYFIIEYKGKKIGLINGKDIDWEKEPWKQVFLSGTNTTVKHIYPPSVP